MEQSTEGLPGKDFAHLKSTIDEAAIVAITDKNGIITYVNRKFCAISKYSHEELIGQNHRIINSKFHPKEFFIEMWKTISSGHTWEGEIRNQAKGGSYYWVNTVIMPFMDENGKLEQYVSVRYDITDKKLAEKLKIEKEAAEIASHTKSQFLANMSHEIRTPLGAILGFAELALDPAKSEKEKTEFVGTIKRNGEHLLDLINDILDLSMVESGNIKIVSEDFLWRSVVNDVIQLLKPKAIAKAIALNYRIDDKSAEFFKSDSHRFRQILMNLIGNAIKFTNSGKIDISCEAKLDTNNSISNLIVSVQDTGIGISADEQKTLFQPFIQANPKLTRKYGGTGLGLDLSRKFARAIGGDIVITQSTLGIGSVFTLTLLGCFRAYQPSIENKPLIGQGPLDPAILRDFKVLLVEDCIDNQVIVKHFLKDTGCELDLATNGREGIEMALNNDFDAVLMDIQMPVMDGYEATLQLRQGGYKKPIIALTAHALNEEREKALSLGFSDYITKPIQRKNLIATLNKYKNERISKTK